MDLPEINKLGARKYFEDGGEYRNPYPRGTSEFNEFERGWMQSLKRDGGAVVSAREARLAAKTSNERAGASTAERYRVLKG